MKIGNGADTREFTRAVQVETYRKCAKSTNTQFEKLAYRHSCFSKQKRWKKWVNIVIVLGGLTEGVTVIIHDAV